MTTKLHISDGLALPLDAVTQTFGLFGIRGSGKTHTATVMVEEMLKAGQPVCIYDPTGAWFGLKSSADAKRPGFPVVVFGGEHPDVPLEPTAGETIARVIVDRRAPAILDCSLMRKGDRVRFMTDFCEALYHRNREPFHFVADEAHTIAPLKPLPESARLLGAMEDIVLQGRRRGLGLTIISQRPALVHTNLRTQCATLIAMRIVGPHDLKAIREWTDAHGTPEQSEQLMGSLSTLKTGEGWVWSPAWLNIFKRVKFRQRETFDSSATPEVGKRVVTPKVFAEIDLAALGEEIKSTVEKQKANDPAALKRRIAELEKQLRDRPSEQVERVVEKIVEVPVLRNGQLDRTEGIAERHERIAERFLAESAELRRLIAPASAPRPQQRPVPAPRAAVAVAQRQPPRVKVTPELREGLTGPEQKILDALAWLESIGVYEPEQTAAAFLAGYTVGGGAFNNPRGALRTKGLIEYLSGDRMKLTDEGRALATAPDTELTTEELHAKVLDRLPGPEQKILTVLLESYPNVMTNEELAAASGYASGGGAYNNPRGRLRTLGLIEYRDGGVVARSILFPETVRR